MNRTTLFRPTTFSLALTLATGLLTGCATTGSPTPEPVAATPAYDSRAEAVFMYQSRIASRVLDRYAYLEIEGAADVDPTLVAADARMADTCRFLNEAAVSRAEGRPAGWELKIKVFATTGACAHAAREVELLLDNDGDSFATAKL